MKGYKGLEIVGNKLKGIYESVFEIGVPQTFDISNIEYTEGGFSFCPRIENVLGWRDFLRCPHIPNKITLAQYGLFEIEAAGKIVCVDNKKEKIHWITNDITIIREVTPQEILKYYNENNALKAATIELYRKHWNIQDIFEKFRHDTLG